MKTLILVCAMGVTQPDCSIATATAVIQGPEAAGPMQCGLHGQAYVASTAIAEYMKDGHYLKIACVPDDQTWSSRAAEQRHAAR